MQNRSDLEVSLMSTRAIILLFSLVTLLTPHFSSRLKLNNEQL